DVTRIFAVAPVGMGTVDLPLQQIGKTDDAVQRRPQFVTHSGEEHGLGGAGHAGRAQGFLQFPLPLDTMRDIAEEADHRKLPVDRYRTGGDLDRLYCAVGALNLSLRHEDAPRFDMFAEMTHELFAAVGRV